VSAGGSGSAIGATSGIFDTAVPIIALVVFLVALAMVPRFATTYWLDVLNRIGIASSGRWA